MLTGSRKHSNHRNVLNVDILAKQCLAATFEISLLDMVKSPERSNYASKHVIPLPEMMPQRAHDVNCDKERQHIGEHHM